MRLSPRSTSALLTRHNRNPTSVSRAQIVDDGACHDERVARAHQEIHGARDRSQRDAEAIAACFTEDAEVKDEGETRRGRDAIRRWWEGPANAFQYTVEVMSAQANEGTYTVFTRLTGNFPGGTADLANRFTLRDDLIASLEIAPPDAPAAG
jgi:ketosteroid isomerase-like protein